MSPCWEKLKGEVKKRKTAEVRHRMGTGGGPPLTFVEDPITAQVETIVPHLDVVIEDTFDSDFHHLATTSYTRSIPPSSTLISSTPSTSNTLPNRSPSIHDSPARSPSPSSLSSLSPSRPYFLPGSEVSADEIPKSPLCPTISAPVETSPRTRPSIKKRRPCKKARTPLDIAERELRARLEMMEEERKYIRTVYEMKIRRYEEKDKIVKEKLREAVAARKIREAELEIREAELAAYRRKSDP